MSDFFQSKSVITLQSICENSQIEAEVRESEKKIVVVIPCSMRHYSLRTIHNLLNQLKTISFIHEIIIVLNGTNTELEYYNNDLVCSTEPPFTLIKVLIVSGSGKGHALKIGFDYVYTHYQNDAILVTLDADLKSFNVDYLLKLVYPIAVFGGHFNKGYYVRFSNNKLDGRLTRLLVFPLLYAIKEQHPTSEFVQWLLAFRYPLSGDVAMSSQLLPQLSLSEHWAYDLSLLASVYRSQQALEIYQTELLDNYEHLHRSTEKNAELGLMEVAKDISDYLTTLHPLNRTRLMADYRRISMQYCYKYQKLALFNGFTYSLETEQSLIARFLNHLEFPAIVNF